MKSVSDSSNFASLALVCANLPDLKQSHDILKSVNDLRSAYDDLEKRMMDAVRVINSVQSEIGVFTCRGGSVSEALTKAWNFNSKFLADNPNFQRMFLKEKGLIKDE